MNAPSVFRKPLAGYLRLTVDRDGNKIGYDVQKIGILAGAQAIGETVGVWYQDKDLTAADRAVFRPQYEQMLTDIAQGKWGGIAVWRLDRLVRLTREFERVWGIVEDTDGLILSCEPLMTTKDGMGLMFMRLLVMLAENEIVGMKTRQRGHQTMKAKAGKYKGGGARPFGFEGAKKDDRGNIVNPGRIGVAHIPHEAELIREAARRIAWEGASYAEVARDWAQRKPAPVGSGGTRFNSTRLWQVLSSPRIAGLRTHTVTDPKTKKVIRTDLYEAEWDEIIDRKTWDRIIAMRNVQEVKRGRPFGYLLTGLARCGLCERLLRGGGSKVQGYRYRCVPEVDGRIPGVCGKMSVDAVLTDQIVVGRVLAQIEHTHNLAAEVAKAPNRDSASQAIDDALAWVSEIDERLGELNSRLSVPVSKGGLSMAEWDVIRLPLVSQREQAVRYIEAARGRNHIPEPESGDWDDLGRWFEGLTLNQRRSLVRRHVESVLIDPATIRGTFRPERVRVRLTDPKHLQGVGDEAGVSETNGDALLGA